MLVPARVKIAQDLKHSLRDLPERWQFEYGDAAKKSLLQLLFRSLAGADETYLELLFRGNVPGHERPWILRDAQGALEGAEYTEAARGKPCGHILKGGEATYRCKTCTTDDMCVLCSRCFEASDHAGHMVSVNISPGNSGCCDCGDHEAWNRPMHCAIHSPLPTSATGKTPEVPRLPEKLISGVKGTISAALDYMCDVISCAPEELRKAKTAESIRHDEAQSRLLSSVYGQADEMEMNPQYALILWNDEKHAVKDVQEQVSRACKKTKDFGLRKAHETDDVGRSVIMVSRDLDDLLEKARIIEQIKITVTIRSARDTFREQMCSTIIEWLLDIAGCSVGRDHDILRQTICEEMLQPWAQGSSASNAKIGRDGIYDHEHEESEADHRLLARANRLGDIVMNANGGMTITVLPNTNLVELQGEGNPTTENNTQDAMEVDNEAGWSDADLEMRADEGDVVRGEPDDTLEHEEATMAGYPPPPPPPAIPPAPGGVPVRPNRPVASLAGPSSSTGLGTGLAIPRTPYSHARRKTGRAPQYWLEQNLASEENLPLAEDIRQRLRLDWMILYDLRLWKKARIDLRDLYIGTVVTIPEFKRILGLRFAGLYTLLAQLYLIADREPDHSIIYLSLQMLTTPSITKEVVDKCNFLTTLVAILYTFLTTRQVGSPLDVSPAATLAFDAGSVTNRRMYHFFMDLKHLFANKYVQEQLRENESFTLQFLDLIKLPQGICPNTRAVGEHVEYETDTWISASILTREVNRLCRQFAEAFKLSAGEDLSRNSEIIRRVALVTLISSLGLDKDRFRQAEIKHAVKLHELPAWLWGEENAPPKKVVKFVVEDEPISFHHPLHYTLSWLIDGAKSMSANRLRDLLTFRAQDVVSALASIPNWATSVLKYDSEAYLLILFDYPLRVCAWLAQMKAGMWVRNGLSLRHQMSQYRGVSQRNLAHQHDIFLLQIALVICDPDRVLLSMIDRFSMKEFMSGMYNTSNGDSQLTPESRKKPYDDSQLLDIVEDFVHLLIILLSERTSLEPLQSEESQQSISIRRELTHVLCFKPLSYSDLCSRLTDKFQDMDEFQDILADMTNYKAPEGVSDVGTFELKKDFLANLDPYIAHYSKNQRDEAEAAYRKWMAEKSGKALDQVVFEPRLRTIHSGVLTELAGFVGGAMFSRIIYHCLNFAVESQEHTPSIPITRIESFLQIVLHLVLISVNEDPSAEDAMNDDPSRSFVHHLLTRTPFSTATIGLLYSLLSRKDLASCHSKIKLILLRAQQKRPKLFHNASEARGMVFDSYDQQSEGSKAEDAQAKKKAALARANKVMASFKQQQQEFLTNQSSIDWGLDDDDSVTSDTAAEGAVQMWQYPSGNCIYCQEECGDNHLYGTFALIQESNILRTTDVTDADHVQEAMDLPHSLDRSAENIRPYGLAGKNFDTVRKFNASGDEINIERQTLGRGWKPRNCHIGPVSRSCGHIMHYSCFELYFNATIRRQSHQIARHHPECIPRMEFVCPLCKALGNTFVPVLRKGAEKKLPSAMETQSTFDEWLMNDLKNAAAKYGKLPEGHSDLSEQPRTVGTSLDWAPETLTSGPLFSSEATTPMAQMTPSTSRASSLSPIVSGIANMPGNFPDDVYGSPPAMALSLQLFDQPIVKNVCFRLKTTIYKNHLASSFDYAHRQDVPEQLCYTDTLVRTIGHTIAATEIAHRGVASESSGLYIDQISAVTLTHLRLLQDFFGVYTATARIQHKNGRAEDEMNRMAQRQLQQLFMGHPKVFDPRPSGHGVKPALAMDPFILLSETHSFFSHTFDKNFQHLIRYCYLLELVKSTHAIWRDVVDGRAINVGTRRISGEEDTEAASAFQQFLAVCGFQQIHDSSMFLEPSFALYAIDRLKPYALAFLRKAVLWVHTVQEVDFSSLSSADADEDELTRLSKALKLPNLITMLAQIGTDSRQEAVVAMQRVVFSWITHFYETYNYDGQSPLTSDALTAIQPSHPAIFELVGLPKYYDILLDEMMRRKCPTKPNRDLTDPALCFFCGDIFCGQAVCCTQGGQGGKGGKGGCNRHMQKCGKNIGLFLMLRKCTVLYLSEESGSFINAPYLDRHGEVDPGLRRNRQLMLNQKRYDALLRTVWLNHMIPTTVARKLEADINNGGWETM